MNNSNEIALNDLSIVFGAGRAALCAVQNASFEILRGESFGLVGESGSGKSTILRAVAGLNSNWTGEISVSGLNVTLRRNLSAQRRLQMVFQDPYGSLHPRHTIDKILREPLQIHKLPNQDEQIVKVLEEVGLSTNFRFRYPSQISGGQRQRVAIARALILEPEILLLDEPTSALDASVQAEILNLLNNLRIERNLTYLMVSHDMAVITHMCDRIAVMNQGIIVETLTREQLRQREATHEYTKRLLAASDGYVRDH